MTGKAHRHRRLACRVGVPTHLARRTRKRDEPQGPVVPRQATKEGRYRLPGRFGIVVAGCSAVVGGLAVVGVASATVVVVVVGVVATGASSADWLMTAKATPITRATTAAISHGVIGRFTGALSFSLMSMSALRCSFD